MMKQKTNITFALLTLLMFFPVAYGRGHKTSDMDVQKKEQTTPHKRHAASARRLISFTYSSWNSYAGRTEEIHLVRLEGKDRGLLTSRVEEMHWDESGEKVPDVVQLEVSDSVLERVDAIIQKHRTYKMKSYYTPIFRVYDASSWSLDVKYEGEGSFSSGGYAEWPDKKLGLQDILQYLSGLLKKD